MKYLFSLVLTSLLINLSAQNAPDFTLTLSDGATKNLYTDYLNNGQTVVLKFFFTTCPPCQSITPTIENLYQEWGAGQHDLEFISLAIYSFDDNNDVNIFKENFGSTWPGAGNDGGSVEAAAPYIDGTFGTFIGTPSFAVIAPDGTMTWDPRGGNASATVDSLVLAIEQTGAQRPQSTVSISGNITLSDGTALSNVILQTGNGTTIPYNGNGFSLDALDAGSNITIMPVKNDNPLNGVTTFDMVLITQHILAITPLDDPYLLSAADVDNSGTVTTLDLVHIRRVILGINTTFPSGQSWKFDPPSVSLTNLTNAQDVNFVAIKVGDVNLSADPNL